MSDNVNNKQNAPKLEDILKMPGIIIAKDQEKHVTIQYRNGLKPEEIVPFCFMAIQAASANQNWSYAVRDTLLKTIPSFFKQMGIRSSAEDEVDKLKAEVERLKALVVELGGVPDEVVGNPDA